MQNNPLPPHPPRKNKGEGEEKNFFYFPHTSEWDLTQQIDCQEYLFDDHVKTIMITPHQIRERVLHDDVPLNVKCVIGWS